MNGDQPLPLGLDEDVPLDLFRDLGEQGDGSYRLSVELTDAEERPHAHTPAERADLRTALADALHHLEANTVPDGSRIRSWRELAGIPSHEAGLTPEEARDDGIARAAAKWTDEEVETVDRAIRALGIHKRAERAEAAGCQRVEPYTDDVIRLGEFTTADVWQALGPAFPVTKGIAGRMIAAKSAGIIANTGRVIIAPRDATGPNHGQRLTVWRAL